MQVRTDERAYVHQLLLNMDIEESKVFVYPRMFSIHDMDATAGRPLPDGDDAAEPVAGAFRVKVSASDRARTRCTYIPCAATPSLV